MKQFKDLDIWQDAHKTVLKIYKQTESFPKSEMFGLTSQYRRAAVSVPANIAEGFRKYSIREKVQFYTTALCSLEECKYYSILSNDLGFCNNSEIPDDLESVGKRLFRYIETIREDIR